MHSRLLHASDGRRSYAVILETGEEIVATLRGFADRENLTGAELVAIGAVSDAVLGYFDWEQRAYRRNPVREQAEIASFIGDIAVGEDGARSLHVHVVLGRRDGSALAGHLFEAHVRPTLEAVVTESPVHLRKRRDPDSGLALIAPPS